MNKTLIILAHPDLAHSTINRCWADALAQHPDRFTVHELYREYAHDTIDVGREQALVEAHRSLVLQFPVYWFNCPPLLKQWLDDVLTYGWAYGSKATGLRGKKAGIAVSLGSPADAYRAGGEIGATVAEALRAFALTVNYCHALWQPIFAFHGIDSTAPGYDDGKRAEVARSAGDYLAHLARYY